MADVRHMILLYHGSQKRVPWTAEALMPYVAHVEESNRPTRWLFDSFLFIEFATDGGAWLHHFREDHPQPTAEDWQWLADAWFREALGLDGLERAVAQAGEVLGDPDHQVNVVITLPTPLRQLTSFGPPPGHDRALDFSRQDGRELAMDWYLDRVVRTWQRKAYRHLRLAGFHWLAESIPGADHEIVRATAKRIHDRGHKLFWIPFFGAQGLRVWRELGIDATMLQPNHFFTPTIKNTRFHHTACKALAAGCCEPARGTAGLAYGSRSQPAAITSAKERDCCRRTMTTASRWRACHASADEEQSAKQDEAAHEGQDL